MNIMEQQMISAKATLEEELILAKWHEWTEPQQSFKVLFECLERTHKRVRSACWGDRMRLAACDALFREAQAGVLLAQESLAAVRATVHMEAEEAQTPPAAESGTDWVQIILLAISAVLALISFVKTVLITNIILGVLAVLCILMALLREGRNIQWNAFLLKLLSPLVKRLHCQWLAKPFTVLAQEKPAAKQFVAAAPNAATSVSIEIKHDQLKDVCMRQMDVIDSNLMLFKVQAVTKDDDGTLLSLVRTMIQEKYVNDDAYPEAVAVELQQYLDDNGLTLLDYAPEHAQHFQTQPMDETFTIFPAILDKNGHRIEYGMAGVQEN